MFGSSHKPQPHPLVDRRSIELDRNSQKHQRAVFHHSQGTIRLEIKRSGPWPKPAPDVNKGPRADKRTAAKLYSARAQITSSARANSVRGISKRPAEVCQESGIRSI